MSSQGVTGVLNESVLGNDRKSQADLVHADRRLTIMPYDGEMV